MHESAFGSVGAFMAVEMFIDRGPNLPESWRKALLTHGVASQDSDGTVRLNERGWRIREQIMVRGPMR